MSEIHPDIQGTISDNERHAFDRLVRGTRLTTQIRQGTAMEMSIIGWECGLRADLRMAFTADAMRALMPMDATQFDMPITTMMDVRAEMVVRASIDAIHERVGQSYCEFSVTFPGDDVETDFTVEIDRFSAKRPIVFIGWAETDQDAPMRPL